MIKTAGFICGLLMVFGAVGTLDANPNAGLLMPACVALVGLGMMWTARPQ